MTGGDRPDHPAASGDQPEDPAAGPDSSRTPDTPPVPDASQPPARPQAPDSSAVSSIRDVAGEPVEQPARPSEHGPTNRAARAREMLGASARAVSDRWRAMSRWGRWTALAALGVVTALVIAAVLVLPDQTRPRPGPGLLARGVDLSDQSYTVGGKEFAEQLVLCQITIAALESAGADVSDDCATVSTDATRRKLLDGDIDMYWEYNGTAWTNHLDRPDPSPDSATLTSQVRAADAAEHGIVWLDATPMNNTYTFAINAEDARRLNAQTLTDMATIIRSGSPDATVCIEPEFRDRPEGWAPMQSKYGFTPDPAKVQILPVDPIYEVTADGNPCVFGEVYATDGRLDALGLTSLRDDKNLLPKYNAALTIRQEAYRKNPDLAKVINPIAAVLSDDVMSGLNARVSIGGEDPADVARDWLTSQNFTTEPRY